MDRIVLLARLNCCCLALCAAAALRSSESQYYILYRYAPQFTCGDCTLSHYYLWDTGIRSPVAIESGESVVVNHHDHAHVQCVLNRGTLDRKPLSFYAHGTATTWT